MNVVFVNWVNPMKGAQWETIKFHGCQAVQRQWKTEEVQEMCSRIGNIENKEKAGKHKQYFNKMNL